MNQVKGTETHIGLQLEMAVNINEALSIVLANEGLIICYHYWEALSVMVLI